MVGEPSVFNAILQVLTASGLPAMCIVLGATLAYIFVVVPERERNDRLEKELNEIFRAHREALNRIQQGTH